jgi:hypothetical protein
MSSNTPVVVSRTQPVPPEEQFWKRYSPHHEFPLSTVSSIALHVLAFVLLGVIAWWLAKLAMDKDKPLPEFGVVIQSGGGGGNPKGEGSGPGGPNAQPEEDPGSAQKEDVNPRPPVDQKNTLEKPSNVPPPVSVDTKDDSTQRLLQDATAAQRSLEKVSREAREKLRRGITPGKGEGGPGRDSGKDRGTDSGKGRDIGPGQDLDVRVKRTMRWVMVFNTYNGDDYARQLAGLGATLAFPQAKSDKYLAVTDLNSRPARGHEDTIEKIQGDRIYWVDDKRESITPLCMTLGIRPTPDHVVAFFPKKLEDKLLELELGYKGLREDQIFETRFAIRKSPRGYEPEVIEQKENPPK